MASSILMSNSNSNSNCATASTPVAAALLSTITNSNSNPASNSSDCTLVIENQALKVTNLPSAPPPPSSTALPTPPPSPLSDVKSNLLATATTITTKLNVVIPLSKPAAKGQQQMIHVKEVQLPSPSSSCSGASFSSKDSAVTARHHGAEVRVVGWKECKAVARTLAEAFKDDPVSLYWLRTDDSAYRTKDQIWKLHLEVCEYIVAAHCMHGLVLSIGPNNDGVALWMPPGKDYDDFWSIFRSGMWRLYYKLTKEGRRRFFHEVNGLAHHTKYLQTGQIATESALAPLPLIPSNGTLPSARGHGYARKLVEYVTKMADASGAPCYLESSHPHNRKIYERFGFEFKREVNLTRVNHGTAPIPWEIMVREPLVVCISVPTGKEA